jgi:hypothetical protein
MPRLITKIKIEIEIPFWEYCNTQESSSNKGSGFCRFLSGQDNKRKCLLHDSSLFSSYDWVKKCIGCIRLAEELGDNGEEPSWIKNMCVNK